MDTNNVATGPKPSFFQRFYPASFCPLPEAPANFKDVLEIESTLHLDFKDRLRVLLSGKIKTHARVVCENEVGQTVPASVSFPIL